MTIEGTKYRKRPVVIEAIQFYESEQARILAWIAEGGHSSRVYVGAAPRLEIDTLEGAITATEGDWIIKGVAGEFYPCKPDIFEATYERVPLSDLREY